MWVPMGLSQGWAPHLPLAWGLQPLPIPHVSRLCKCMNPRAACPSQKQLPQTSSPPQTFRRRTPARPQEGDCLWEQGHTDVPVTQRPSGGGCGPMYMHVCPMKGKTFHTDVRRGFHPQLHDPWRALATTPAFSNEKSPRKEEPGVRVRGARENTDQETSTCSPRGEHWEPDRTEATLSQKWPRHHIYS